MTNEGNMPLVSIGIPTYNRANTGNLQKVIERSLGQTYQNIEVIVSDNCSPDNTSEIVNSYTDSRLKYFRQDTNIGPYNNFNFCLEQANGEYFLLFHDDDDVEIDFIETCISSLKPGQTVGVIYTGIQIIDENDNVIEKHENNAGELSAIEFVLAWFKGKVALYICNSLYNTEKLKEVGGFHSKFNLYNDLVPTFKLVGKYGRIDIQGIKASFRRHSTSMGSNIPMKSWIGDAVYLLDTLKQLFPDDRDTLNEVGSKYFCKKMYIYTSRRKGFFQRWKDYLDAYKTFNYCLSPFEFVYLKNIRPRIKRLMGAG